MVVETKRWMMIPLVCCLFTGCGLSQSIKNGSVAVVNTLFYKKITTLRLTFVSRAASNSDAEQKPLATMVRIWQLKTAGDIAAIDYSTLLLNAATQLGDNIVDSRELLITPQTTVNFTMPLHEAAQVVLVAGLFNRPDTNSNQWRLLLTRAELDADQPRLIQLSDGKLTLLAKE